MAKRRRWEEELEREAESKPQLARQLADLDEGKRAGVLEELQRGGGNRAFQQAVGGRQLQREAAAAPSYTQRETRTYMSVDGVPGPALEKAHKGQFEVIKYSHKTVSPRDSASGQATGKRQHSAVTVVLPTSEGTVPFRDAVTKNMVLPKVVVYRPSQVITMTNVSVVEVEDLDEDKVLLKFVYQKIEWSTPGEGGGQTATDDWVAPT